jgi:putative hemolysin
VVHDRLPALDAVEQLRDSKGHMLLVYDVYGDFEGIITPMAILGAIAGGFDEDEREEPEFLRRDDGSFLVSGAMPIDEFMAQTGLTLESQPVYETVAGMILDRVNDIPTTGQNIRIGEWVVEIVDMDGQRIDKILLQKTGETDTDADSSPRT